MPDPQTTNREEHEWVFRHKHSTQPVCRKCGKWETAQTASLPCVVDPADVHWGEGPNKKEVGYGD